MSKIRAIKVKSCMGCPYGHTGECQNVRITNAIDPIPDSCPLPKWPSISQKLMDRWAHKIREINEFGYPTVSTAKIKEMLLSIGVEIKENPDD